jgi:hypothetical protein
MHLVRPSHELVDAGAVAGWQMRKGEDVVHGRYGSLLKLSLTSELYHRRRLMQ